MRASEFTTTILREYTLRGFPVTVIARRSLTEALKISAPQRVIPRDELQNYLGRIKTGTKTKQDKFAPIIHQKNIKITKSEDPNDLWDLDELASLITKRPGKVTGKNAKMTKSASILDKNTKMSKSSQGGEVFYDITLPALKGIVVDEETGDFVEISTCPSAGECQLYCYARKGGYIQYPAASLSAGRLLNFLVNDPVGFSKLVDHEVKVKHKNLAKKGVELIVRWHDAGDFFSKEYAELAFDIARNNPDVKFYAYTKSSDISLGEKPSNFITRFSSGAHPTDKSKIKQHQEKGNKVLQAHTVPKDMFDDLILKHGKSVVKDEHGIMKFKDPQSYDEFKQRIANAYNVPVDTVITYDQMLKIPEDDTPKWSVLTFPGHGDKAAYRKDVLNNLLIFH